MHWKTQKFISPTLTPYLHNCSGLKPKLYYLWGICLRYNRAWNKWIPNTSREKYHRSLVWKGKTIEYKSEQIFSALDPKSKDFTSMGTKNIRHKALTISLKVWVILKTVLNCRQILEPNVTELLRKLFIFPFLLITLIKKSVFHVNMSLALY